MKFILFTLVTVLISGTYNEARAEESFIRHMDNSIFSGEPFNHQSAAATALIWAKEEPLCYLLGNKLEACAYLEKTLREIGYGSCTERKNSSVIVGTLGVNYGGGEFEISKEIDICK